MKRFFTALAVALTLCLLCNAAPKKKAPRQEVTFVTSMDCAHCATKVKENIAFEKGVVGLDIKLEDKTVRIVYNPEKTDPEKLAKAINKLGYTAEEKK